MSINYWRYVEYTDDGCSLYECLSCYQRWESRTIPGWFDLDDSYKPVFKFCPFCGIEWAGMRTTPFSRLHEGHRQLGRRRHRIETAIERRRDQWRRDEGPYPGSPHEPPYWLVVERAERNVRDGNKPLVWVPQYKMSGFHPSAKRMLELAREDLAREKAEHEQTYSGLDPDSQYHWKKEFFTRVIAVGNLEARYPQLGHLYEIRL